MSNYEREIYELFLPNNQETSNEMDNMDTSVGFSEVDHTIPDVLSPLRIKILINSILMTLTNFTSNI